MLVFHEGLPRSGKSYEAVVAWIIPALKKGRTVYSNIEGLDTDKLALLADVSPEDAARLLIPLTSEQIKEIHLHVTQRNALVVIDELQDHFPMSMLPLPPQVTSFVSQHGHKGLDIVAMGQSYKDCHSLWKRRIDRKLYFIKKDVVGKPTEYHWRLEKQISNGRWEKVSEGSKPYDPKYFGCYKSFEDEADDTALLEDKRANVFNNWQFKVGIPAFGVLLLAGVVYLLYLFFGGGFEKMATAPVAKPKSVSAAGAVGGVPPQAAKPEPPRPAPPPVKEEKDYISSISDKWRPRVSGSISMGSRVEVVIEWLDDSYRVRERLTSAGLAGFGYAATIDAGGVTIGGPRRKPIRITSWPLDDPAGRASQRHLRQAKGEAAIEPLGGSAAAVARPVGDAVK